ncbi:LLM class flavin-dependent oxidoreductase [Georgenia sunbinii]|uniref:LLM class flavin-dependent oxidoreductase n=1 Tax=Georgenia sunbinii TaxID=3117728 RepID=UPI002F2621DB
MTELSILLPAAESSTSDVLSFAELISDGPARRLWQGQTSAADPIHSFVRAAGAGAAVPTGVGVTLMPLRHPFEAAVEARSLARLTGREAVVGYGPGGRSLQQALLGRPYQRPLQATREYVSTVADLLAGRSVDVAGDYVTCRAALPPAPAEQPSVEVGVGVLRPGMARVAGACADVAITWLTPPRYLREVLRPALEAGAREAGRRPPRLVAMVPLALEGPDVDLAQLVLASNGAHLRREHYRDMLVRAGVALHPHNSRASALELNRSDGFLHGTVDDVVDGLRRYADAGVDEVVLNATGSAQLRGLGRAREELEEILLRATAAVTEADPGQPSPSLLDGTPTR